MLKNVSTKLHLDLKNWPLVQWVLMAVLFIALCIDGYFHGRWHLSRFSVLYVLVTWICIFCVTFVVSQTMQKRAQREAVRRDDEDYEREQVHDS